MSKLALNQFLPYLLTTFSQQVNASWEEIYTREFGLNNAEWRILANLAETPGLSAKALRDKTLMDKSKVSRAVLSLEQKGCICRQSHQGDQRALLLVLSEKGDALYQSIVPLADQWQKKLMADLNQQDKQHFLQVIEHLQNSVRS